MGRTSISQSGTHTVVTNSQIDVIKKKKRNDKAECKICMKIFTRTFSLRQHQKNCSTKECLFRCETCGSTYYKAEYLKRHKCRDHSGLTLLCDLCLVRGGHHVDTLASGDNSYTCDYCNALTIFPFHK